LFLVIGAKNFPGNIGEGELFSEIVGKFVLVSGVATLLFCMTGHLS